VLLQASLQRHPATSALTEKILPKIRQNAWQLRGQTPGDSILSHVGYDCMKLVMADSKMAAAEYTMFSLLNIWASSGVSTQKEANQAKELVKKVNLKGIPPEHLFGKVSLSGLVTIEDIHAAIVNQVKHKISTGKEGEAIGVKRYAIPRWYATQTADILYEEGAVHPASEGKQDHLPLPCTVDCAPMMPGGRYKWRIKIVETGLPSEHASVLLSLITPASITGSFIWSHNPPEKLSGKLYWSWDNKGNVTESEGYDPYSLNDGYSNGDVIEFEFLYTESGDASLSASVNEGPQLQVLTLPVIDFCLFPIDQQGVYPAVRLLKSSCQVRVLSFAMVEDLLE
jgi:hypothetical protein